MNLQVVQIPVLKQGVWETGNWSTRVLTMDAATGTVTISRHHHPKNLLYHSLQLELVQMWPHFTQRDLEDYIKSIEAKMTLRMIGVAVPVPDLSERRSSTAEGIGEAALTCSAGSTTPSPARREHGVALSATSFSFVAGDRTKKSRRVDAGETKREVWMVRFTTYESYELAIRMLHAMHDQDGHNRQLLSNHAHEDLETIRKAWVKAHGEGGPDVEAAAF